MADELDFSSPASGPKPAPAPSAPAAALAPVYIPAIARAFFESVGKEEAMAPGTVFFAENEKAGFRTREWPEQLAGGRNVVDFQVRTVDGAPVGAIAWESLEERPDRLFSEGLKLFRMTPGTLWSAECAAIAPGKDAASAYFAEHSELLGVILRSVRFPYR